jgi:hypothetical protein
LHFGCDRTGLAAFDQPDRFHFELQRVLATRLPVVSRYHLFSLQLLNLTINYEVSFSGATSLNPSDHKNVRPML